MSPIQGRLLDPDLRRDDESSSTCINGRDDESSLLRLRGWDDETGEVTTRNHQIIDKK